jgi:hypothetical protein
LGLVVFCVLSNANGRNTRIGSPSPPDDELITKLAAAKKPAVGQPLVIEGVMVCGPKGNTPDEKMKELNNNKNRTDEPGPDDFVAIDWDDMKDLPVDRADDIQGAPVSVTGFLSRRVKVENEAPGESTNCNHLQDDQVDWHMYLTKQPHQQIKRAIIVETTPRVRPNHKWTTEMLQPFVNKNKRVRISGWLLFDFQHLGVVGTQRASIWEVHPITRIEVQDADGNWVNIEH